MWQSTDVTAMIDPMPYRIVCNGVEREGAKPSPDLVSGLSCNVPLHNIRYGIIDPVTGEVDRSAALTFT